MFSSEFWQPVLFNDKEPIHTRMIKRTSIKHHHAKADRDMHFTQQSRVTVHWAAAKITAFSLKWRNTLFARRLSKRTGLCHLIAFLNQLFCGFPHAEKHIHSAFFIGSFLQHALSLPVSNYTNDVAKCNAMYDVWKVCIGFPEYH